MKVSELDTVGNRLRQALEASGLSKSKFMEELAPKLRARRIPGASMPALYRYLDPFGTPPTVPWLEEAANILGVEATWLEEGTGPRSKAEAKLRPTTTEHTTGLDAVLVDTEDPRTVADHFLNSAPALLGMGDEAVKWALGDVVAKIITTRGLDLDSGRTWEQTTQEVETAVLAALEPAGRALDRPGVLAVLATIEAALDRK